MFIGGTLLGVAPTSAGGGVFCCCSPLAGRTADPVADGELATFALFSGTIACLAWS